MDLWQVGLIVVIVVGFGLVVFGALWDRARNRRRAREMLSPPPRTIPQFRPDAPAPHYLSDLQARRRRTGTDGTALTAEERERINRQIADAQTVTVPTGYASRDFVTDPTSGWAVLDHPAVLVCADPVDSIRELLPVLERLIMTGTPLVVARPGLSAEVRATLEVNAIQQTMRLLAVTPDAADPRQPGRRLRRGPGRPLRPPGRLLPGRAARPLRALGQHRQGQPRDHLRRGHRTPRDRLIWWAYVAALAPIIFGTTYLLTSDFLPPGRPLLAALLRSLPTGLILVIGTRPPDRRWLGRLAVLSVLYASGLFPLLFLAAYLLPGGVASVINSISPLLVVVLSVPLLGAKIHPVQVGAGVLGIGGVGPAGAALRRPGWTRSACWP